jgi:hypothetical protein
MQLLEARERLRAPERWTEWGLLRAMAALLLEIDRRLDLTLAERMASTPLPPDPDDPMTLPEAREIVRHAAGKENDAQLRRTPGEVLIALAVLAEEQDRRLAALAAPPDGAA